MCHFIQAAGLRGVGSRPHPVVGNSALPSSRGTLYCAWLGKSTFGDGSAMLGGAAVRAWYDEAAIKAGMCEVAVQQSLKLHIARMPTLVARCPSRVLSTSVRLEVGPFYCFSCNKNFKRKGDFNRHLKSHDRKTWAKCPFCSHRTSQKSNLDGHINKKHTGEKPHKCGWCSLCFADKSDRAKHRKRAHQELADVFEYNAGVGTRVKKLSIAPVLPAARTLSGRADIPSPGVHVQQTCYDASTDSDASFTPVIDTPIEPPPPYTTFIANDLPQELPELLAYWQASPMTMTGPYTPAYSSPTSVAADYPDSPLNPRIYDGLTLSEMNGSRVDIHGQWSPPVPHPCLVSQLPPSSFVQRSEWVRYTF